MAGFISLEKADVRWFLSVDRKNLPNDTVQEKSPTFRSITVDGDEIEFSGGFTDLRTLVYKDILEGQGFGIEDAGPSLDLVYTLRSMEPVRRGTGRSHPFVEQN